jgi:DnaK suppressor protein
MDEGRARALLRAERAEVATLLRQTEEAESVDQQVSDSPVDEGDAGQSLTEQATDEAVADQLRTRLDAIDRALARLEAGSYGRSVLSGKPIPSERLEADPAAELTIEEASAQRLCAGPISLPFIGPARGVRGVVPPGDSCGERPAVTAGRSRTRPLSGRGCGSRAWP